MVTRVLTISIDATTQKALAKRLHRTRLKIEERINSDSSEVDNSAEDNVHDIVLALCGHPIEFSIGNPPCVKAHQVETLLEE